MKNIKIGDLVKLEPYYAPSWLEDYQKVDGVVGIVLKSDTMMDYDESVEKFQVLWTSEPYELITPDSCHTQYMEEWQQISIEEFLCSIKNWYCERDLCKL